MCTRVLCELIEYKTQHFHVLVNINVLVLIGNFNKSTYVLVTSWKVSKIKESKLLI